MRMGRRKLSHLLLFIRMDWLSLRGGGFKGAMGAITIEGRQSVWGSGRATIVEIWMEGVSSVHISLDL